MKHVDETMTELSVVVPTFNEAKNIGLLYGRLRVALAGCNWEMIVVDDDSPDGTAEIARALGSDVRVLQRIGRRGLSTAVIEGMMASPARFIAVIDADLQHDETKLPAMLDLARSGAAELVIGSRYAGEGGIGEWSERRAWMSRLATIMAKRAFRVEMSDPMSGFFLISRETMMRAVRQTSGEGYKILLDLVASHKPPLRIVEVPYTFRPRVHGESKLDTAVLWEYLVLLLDKTVGRFVPPRLLLFLIVGGIGVIIHYAAFAALFLVLNTTFSLAQFVATMIAMTGNYIFNNVLTYRDARKKGVRFLLGLLGFYLVCSIGLLANVGIASVAYEQQYQWWAAAFAGILVGTIWNYAASSIFVWKRRI